MKKSEIKVGNYYTNGKGRFRLVTAEDLGNVLVPGSIDYLEYHAWETREKGLLYENKTGSYGVTRTSFAAWARRKATKAEIKELIE